MSEHDPITELTRLGTGGIAVSPLPPAEVRRLGDRRRTRRRTTRIAVVAAAAVVAVAVPFALNGGDHRDASRSIAHHPKPTPAKVPKVITYPGAGIEVRSAADTAKLTGTTADFKTFIAAAAAQATADGNSCPGAAAVVTVHKYSSAGYALGGVNDCGGYAALWVQHPESGQWTEGLGTQDVWDCDGLRYLGVPKSFAGDCFDYTGFYGPTEVDGLRIGMTKAQILAAGGKVEVSQADCKVVTLPHGAPVAGQGDGWFTSRYGLVALVAKPGDKTPEKVGLGSIEAKVRAAYPNATPVAYGAWRVPLAHGNAYLIGFDGSRVVDRMYLIGPHLGQNQQPLCLG